MPIDPNIPLSFRPAPVENPLETYGRVMTLQNMLRQQQMGNIQLRQAQRSMQREDAAQEMFSTAAGKMPTDTEILGKLGPTMGSSVLKGLRDAEEARQRIQETKGKIASSEADYAGGLGAMVRDAGYSPEAWSLAVNHARQAGYGDTVAQLNAAVQQDPAKLKTVVDAMISRSPKQQELINSRTTAAASTSRAASTAAQVDLARHKWDVEKPGAQATSTLKGLEVAGQTVPNNQADWDGWRAKLPAELQSQVSAMYSPVEAQRVERMGMTPFQRGEITGQEAGRTETARHNQVEEGQAAGRLAVERANSARMQRQYDATYGALLGPNGEKLDPDAQKAIAEQDPMARAVANYQLPPPTAGRSGPGAAVLRKVMAINPTYNAQNWQTQSAMLKGYTSGQQSKELSGINTALGHVGVLGDAIDALGNGDMQALNRVATFLKVQTGADAATTFKAIVHKVAPEINRAYVGGVGSQGEILSQESDFDPKMGPQQLKSNVAVTAKLLRSKIGSLENQWKQTMGSDFEGRFIMPEAKAVADKWAPPQGSAPAAGGPGGARQISVTDPTGGVHVFNSQAEADKFKKLAGIK